MFSIICFTWIISDSLVQVIAEYRETNKELQKRISINTSNVSPASPKDTSNTLEADDSKTDTSIIEATPIAVKKSAGEHLLYTMYMYSILLIYHEAISFIVENIYD